jgi:large subunit ribosomal protein L21
MYAIIETGGKQYRVQPGDTIEVERLDGEPGSTLELDRVLMVGGDGSAPQVGSPTLPGASVKAEVVDQKRGEKIIVFRFKSKVRYRRKTGHRQELTRLRITDIVLQGGRARAAAAAPAEQRREESATTAAAPGAVIQEA